MCGIFGFALRSPMHITKVFRVLQKVEVHQYSHEPKPVGGFGAGIAFLNDDGTVTLEKVGNIGGSPVIWLSEIVKVYEVSVLVGHVRMPRPQFMETAKFKETAQPYVTECFDGSTIISAHNGNVTNYKMIRERLGEKHTFESEKIELIDSEVIPHLFEECLAEKVNPNNALEALFQTLEGPNTISLLQVETKCMLLHFIHKGKTRGLTIWTNNREEVIFCSRREPLMEEFGDMLKKGEFKEQIYIPYGEYRNLKMTLALPIRQ